MLSSTFYAQRKRLRKLDKRPGNENCRGPVEEAALGVEGKREARASIASYAPACGCAGRKRNVPFSRDGPFWPLIGPPARARPPGQSGRVADVAPIQWASESASLPRLLPCPDRFIGRRASASTRIQLRFKKQFVSNSGKRDSLSPWALLPRRGRLGRLHRKLPCSSQLLWQP